MRDETAARLHGYLVHFGKKYPKLWGKFERMYFNRGQGGVDWPDHVFVPMNGIFSVVANPTALRLGLRTADRGMMHDIAALGALAPWRLSQGIYRFDPTLLDEVWRTSVRALPVDLLEHMPAWCVYVEAKPGVTWLGQPVLGAFIHREHDLDSAREELRLLIDLGNPNMLMAVPIPLGSGTLQGGLDEVFAESRRTMGGVPEFVVRQSGQLVKDVVEPLVSCLMYLCAQNADYRAPERVTVKRLKGGGRALFPADQPRVVEVGTAIGRRIREARERLRHEGGGEGETGRRMGIHLRGPHYQTYWHGSKTEGKQRPVLTYKLPFLAGFGSDDEDLDVHRPAVVNKVSRE